MKIAVTGASGLVGWGIAAHLAGQGHAVTALGRRPVAVPGIAHLPFDLAAAPPDLSGFDALVHAAFSHVPGRYRGGEGSDPAGFRALNVDATLRLSRRAQGDGVRRILFLSSRAVYGGYPAGTDLPDGLPARPDTLYGQVKAEVEDALAAMAGPDLATASLRATGIYGPPVPGHPHKWTDLFAAFDKGEAVPPRIGTEVHAGDLAAAVQLLLTTDQVNLAPVTFNVSDILLDHRDLLATYAALTGRAGHLPAPADPTGVSVMQCDRLTGLGWHPRGVAGVSEALQAILAAR